MAGCAALPPPYEAQPRSAGPGEDRLGDRVGLIEFREMAGAGDRLHLGLAGDAVREFISVAARHDAVLFTPEEEGRRFDQWQPFFEFRVAERPKDARRRLARAGLLDRPFRRVLAFG